MAGSVNKVILVGRVGRDPEIRSVGSGSRVANIRLATSETWKDKRSGEKKERTEWHSVVVWNEPTVNFIEQYVGKGDQLYVEGQLQTRKWEDQNGVEKYSTEIVVQGFGGNVLLLQSKDGGGRGDDEDRGSRRSRDDDRGGRSTERRPEPASSGESKFDNDLDDDIPF